MQSKLDVSIFVLGLDDILDSPPSNNTSDFIKPIDLLGKVGYITPKPGEKCVVIRGDDRKVHGASKVLIHTLVERCYDGEGREAIQKELRKSIRQVRKKKSSSPFKSSKRPIDSSAVAVSASRPCNVPPSKKKATTEAVEALAGAAGAALSQPTEVLGPIHRGFSPDPTEESPVQIGWSPVQKHPRDEMHWNTKGGPTRLIIEDPVEDETGWRMHVHSPVNVDELFDVIVGPEGENKRRLVQKFNDCLIVINQSPLSVRVRARYRASVVAAAEHIAHMLHEHAEQSKTAPSIKRYPGSSYSANRQGNAGSNHRPSVAAVPDGTNGWRSTVWAPVEQYPTFDFINCLLGFGGSMQREVARRFNVRISLGGRGVRSSNDAPNKPLHVTISGPVKVNVENASRQIESMWHPVAVDNNTNRCSKDLVNLDPMHPHGPMQMVIAPSFQEGSVWTILIGSPLDKNMLFSIFVGDQARKKRKYEEKFRCNIWIKGEPLHVKVSARDLPTLEAAAEQIASIMYNVWHDRRMNIDDPMGLVMEGPYCVNNDWHIKVRSPVSEALLYGAIVGDKGETVRLLQAKLGVNLHLRGDGLTGVVTGRSASADNPQHVDVCGISLERVEAATSYIVKILLTAASTAMVSSRPYDTPYQHPDSAIIDGPRSLFMGNAFLAGPIWHKKVKSALSEDELFRLIVGRGAEKKKKLVEIFSGCYINLRGGGLNDSMSDEPLHVDLSCTNRATVEAAAEHVSTLIYNEYTYVRTRQTLSGIKNR